MSEASPGTEPSKFLEMCVRDAIAVLNTRRLYGHRISREEAMEAFWHSWDSRMSSSPLYPDDSKSDILRIGERCISNFVRTVGKFGCPEIVSCNIIDELGVPGGHVGIRIDEIAKYGNSLVLVRYMTNPGIASRSVMENDSEMFLSAQWVRYNIPDSDNMYIQWRFLHSDTEFESPLPLKNIDDTVRNVGRRIAVLKSCRAFPQRESEYCFQCRYRNDCPRYTHALSEDMGGRELVTRYSEVQERIDSLKKDIEMLELERDGIGSELIAYADSHGYSALTDGNYKASVSHLKKAELPREKSQIIRILTESGKLAEMSTVNYSRLRADIVKGIADPKISELAEIIDYDRIHLRKIKGD